jgi:hypothetical protein
MKNTREVGRVLEEYILSLIKQLDPKARLSKNSGANNDIADIISKYFYTECKRQLTNRNAIIKQDEWEKLNKKIIIGSLKIPIMAIENNAGSRFLVIAPEDFFRICKKLIVEGYSL